MNINQQQSSELHFCIIFLLIYEFRELCKLRYHNEFTEKKIYHLMVDHYFNTQQLVFNSQY